jgi:hypothetical protein
MEGAVHLVTNGKSLPRVLLFLEDAIGNERQERVLRFHCREGAVGSKNMREQTAFHFRQLSATTMLCFC